MSAVEPMLHHDDPPTMDEVETALSRQEKLTGFQILPEMIFM